MAEYQNTTTINNAFTIGKIIMGMFFVLCISNIDNICRGNQN